MIEDAPDKINVADIDDPSDVLVSIDLAVAVTSVEQVDAAVDAFHE